MIIMTDYDYPPAPSFLDPAATRKRWKHDVNILMHSSYRVQANSTYLSKNVTSNMIDRFYKGFKMVYNSSGHDGSAMAMDLKAYHGITSKVGLHKYNGFQSEIQFKKVWKA